MSKRKNKFIYVIIALILLIIGFSIYSTIFQKKVDRNSYVTLIQGEGEINNESLTVEERSMLSIGDIVKTTKEDSLAVIEWGDGSITRLGNESEIIVNELFVSDNKDKLNISFELISGKTWSNVISYVGEDSYFKETFMDTEAAVRGTIFNLDLTKEYLYVVDHSVKLTNSEGEEYIVNEKEPFNIMSFSFIELKEFIMNVKDKAFENLNREIDKEFLNKLEADLKQKIDDLIALQNIDLSTLDLEERNETYKKILEKYQEINFARIENKDLYDIKLDLKNKLIELAPEEEKVYLLKSTLIDFNDALKAKNYDVISVLGETISNNESYVNKDELIDILKNKNIGDDIKNIINEKMPNFQGVYEKILNENYMDVINNGIKDEIENLDILNQGKDLGNKADAFIKDGLNNLINK